MFHGIKTEAQARRALAEIERLLNEADSAGLSLDPWLRELAAELRDVLPEMDPPGAAAVAERILADPPLSRAAQARLRADTVRVLRA